MCLWQVFFLFGICLFILSFWILLINRFIFELYQLLDWHLSGLDKLYFMLGLPRRFLLRYNGALGRHWHLFRGDLC